MKGLHLPSDDAQSRARRLAGEYALVVASVVLTTLVRSALTPFFGSRLAFLTYFPALVFSAWVGGWGGGLLALALSAFAATFFFLSPSHTLYIASPTDRVTLLVFIIVGLSVSAISSSQRKMRGRAEQIAAGFRESEARKSVVLEVALDCIISIDADGRIVEFNPAAEQTFGYTRGEVMGRPIADVIIPPALRDAHRKGLAHYLATGEGPVLGHRIELIAVRRGGEEFPVELAIVPLTSGDRPEFIAYLRDISARKASEQVLATLYEREHTIATRLQDALQPKVPASVPGLRVAPFTQPALDEAEIGGDFYDVFALDKELYALVVGDVSGKGLAAAAQLALVRNSLRTTLYQYRAPTEAVTILNTILTAHDLLLGFVTAFVGIYDAATGLVTFASCGHEPGLLRRAATGEVETLDATGPPLGIAVNADYEEGSVVLSEGDTLLLYTDGLSEAGPSRRELLGTEGLTDLMMAQPLEQDVQASAQDIVASVSAYADGEFRDDVCLLLLRRETR